MTIPRKLLRGLVLPAVLLVVWQAVCSLGIADARLVASPAAVWRYFAASAGSGDLLVDLGASLGRDLLGYAIGATVGVAGGVLLSLSRLTRDLLLPGINALKQVSIFAWVPLISIWFGLGEGARLFVIAFSVWFPVLFNTLEGIAAIPRELRELPAVYGLNLWQTVRRLILPAALPSIFTGLYVGLVMAWMVTLGAEYMLTSTRGLGHLLFDGRENFRMDQVLVGAIVVGIVGYLIHAIADAIERRALAWRGTVTEIRIL
ncbi:ABC transporter permease [Sphingomonas abietis]|uniref:ABC transporter permease n=1 Tax=Sphingomonas abietis TaxID=3012344 RepID=A0ABY7NIK5_9SPHN|nr:ABC transporter permease [Sphingomonas abietis]WBO21357.1 ABC transporter permease [Sphingomonas abietis]